MRVREIIWWLMFLFAITFSPFIVLFCVTIADYTNYLTWHKTECNVKGIDYTITSNKGGIECNILWTVNYTDTISDTMALGHISEVFGYEKEALAHIDALNLNTTHNCIFQTPDYTLAWGDPSERYKSDGWAFLVSSIVLGVFVFYCARTLRYRDKILQSEKVSNDA